jgi:hypothetical protein
LKTKEKEKKKPHKTKKHPKRNKAYNPTPPPHFSATFRSREEWLQKKPFLDL